MFTYTECALAKIRTYNEVISGFLPALKDYYEDPEAYNIEPFKIFGNLYYVGDKKVCMHLIDTGDGLILFDSGYSHNFKSLVNSINKLGFRCEDIKYVIHSHGHFDHFGGGDRLRDLYGAKIFMSKIDTELLKEMPERALMHLAPNKEDEICWPDETIEDGDCIELGNTKIRCVSAPGHTPGTMAFFFQATDGATSHKVGYLGGLGFLSIHKAFCRQYNLPENMNEQMIATVNKLRNEDVEIMLGNHPGHNSLIAKREYMLHNDHHNPFINKNAWGILMSSIEEKCLEFAQKGY